MRKTWSVGLAVTAFVAALSLPRPSAAFQEMYGVSVNNAYYQDGFCTVQISQSHPFTSATDRCNKQVFSWQCYPDDYRLELARLALAGRQSMNIRYSEFDCGPFTNMKLLTAW